MKQYEKMEMSTEDALKWVDGCKTRLCADCSAREHRPGAPAFCAVSYLLSEVPEPPKVPRWMTAKTQEDFDNLFADFLACCAGEDACQYCCYNNHGDGVRCFYEYASELVDAPESEVDK